MEPAQGLLSNLSAELINMMIGVEVESKGEWSVAHPKGKPPFPTECSRPM